MNADCNFLTVAISADCGEIKLDFSGRDAWALNELITAGENGCTPIDNPAPRWSGYVFKLRKAGLNIETIHETHRGDFPGTHARYVLRSQLHVVAAKHFCERDELPQVRRSA